MDFKNNGTAEFVIQMLGNKNQQTYLGKFKVKCALTPLDHINADKLNRELLGANLSMASDRAMNLAFALSQLKYRVIESPPFWQTADLPGNIEDDNIIFEVLNRAIEAEEKYLQRKSEDAENAEKELSNGIESGRVERQEE